jgi:hypothetical protein
MTESNNKEVNKYVTNADFKEEKYVKGHSSKTIVTLSRIYGDVIA